MSPWINSASLAALWAARRLVAAALFLVGMYLLGVVIILGSVGTMLLLAWMGLIQ